MSDRLHSAILADGPASDSGARIAAEPRLRKLYAAEDKPLTPREAFSLVVRSWRFIREHRRLVAMKCALAFSSLVFFLLSPWPVKIVIDNVIDGHPLTGVPKAVLTPLVGDNRALLLAVLTGFLVVTAILIGLAGNQPVGLGTAVASGGLDQAGFTANEANDGWSLWSGLFGLLEVFVTLDLTQRINQGVRVAIYERFLRSPLGLFGDQKIGDAVFRVMNDSAAIGAVLYRGVLAPLLSAAMFILTLAVLTAQFSNEPLIPIIAALTLPIVAIGATLFGRMLREQGQRMRERGSDVMAAFEERLAQVHLIKAYGQESREEHSVDEASWESFRATLKLLVIILAVIAVVTPALAALVAVGIYHLMMQVVLHRITLGDVVLLASYGIMLARPMRTIGATWADLQTPVSGLRRIHSVLDMLAETDGSEAGALEPGPIREIAVRDVTLAYDGAGAVLEHVTFTLRSGELLALAGASGVGKTTLICAIPRFIEPRAGAILVNGVDSRQIALGPLRARIGFVFQHEALFSRSLADNIRYGAPEASDEEMREAARMAGAAEFIENLPQGYATILGRRGTRLSIGQKQRVAIARAMLRKPDVLILDEPTAALDPASERALMATLRMLAAERIVVVVAHRAATLAACDRVVFLARATVAAEGPHTELVRVSEDYRRYLAITESVLEP